MESALVFVLSPAVMSAYLFDVAEGRYRFVGRGQAPTAAWPDATVVDWAGAAAREVERVTGRTIFSRDHPLTPEESDGSGVDLLAAAVAPGGALRVAVVGSDVGLTYDSCPRAVEGAGHEIIFSLALDQQWVRTVPDVYDAVRQLRQAGPEAILVSAQLGKDSEEQLGRFAEALIAVNWAPGFEAPTVVFAGDDVLWPVLRERIGHRLSLRVAPNIRPVPGSESLEHTKDVLAALHSERWFAQLPESERFASWLASPPVPRDLALGRMFRYLSAVEEGVVLGLDLDRSSFGLFLAAPGVFSTFRLRPSSLAPAEVAPWLPWDRGQAALDEVLLNLRLRPFTLPATREEAACERALLCALCRKILEDPRRPVAEPPLLHGMAQVIGTGHGTACAPTVNEAAMLLLDAAQPAGVGYLRWDSPSLLAAVGALAEEEPHVTAELALNEAPRKIATFASPAGVVRAGATAVEVEAVFKDGAVLGMEVASGAIEALPVPAGSGVTVSMRAAERLNLGDGRGKRVRREVEPTPLGLVVDARGRPIFWPQEAGARLRMAALNRQSLGCQEPGEADS